jgi:hypothetical protein
MLKSWYRIPDFDNRFIPEMKGCRRSSIHRIALSGARLLIAGQVRFAGLDISAAYARAGLECSP